MSSEPHEHEHDPHPQQDVPYGDRPSLRVVDTETGETVCVTCAQLRDRLAVLQTQLDGSAIDIAAWRSRYFRLKDDREERMAKDPLWPKALELFKYWREQSNHMGCKWGLDRYELVVPFLKKDGFDMCKRAIDGGVYDPYVTVRKNGTKKRHDGWDLIFRNRDKFEECCNKAPLKDPQLDV